MSFSTKDLLFYDRDLEHPLLFRNFPRKLVKVYRYIYMGSCNGKRSENKNLLYEIFSENLLFLLHERDLF